MFRFRKKKPTYYYKTPAVAALPSNARTVFQTEAFVLSNRSTVCLSENSNDPLVLLDIAKAPHVLVGGTTGSGKSVTMHSIIVSLLLKNTRRDARFIMIDMKVEELSVYNESPMMAYPVITDAEEAISVLERLCDDMKTRYRIKTERGAYDWDDTGLPRYYVFIDELADLMMTGGKRAETAITRLAQMGRAAGIHLILATQQPTAKVITTLIKANVPARIGLRTKNSTASLVVMDETGCEKLAGRGDSLLQRGYEAGTEHFQGLYIDRRVISGFLATAEYVVEK